jgi:hypothetical protein
MESLMTIVLKIWNLSPPQKITGKKKTKRGKGKGNY